MAAAQSRVSGSRAGGGSESLSLCGVAVCPVGNKVSLSLISMGTDHSPRSLSSQKTGRDSGVWRAQWAGAGRGRRAPLGPQGTGWRLGCCLPRAPWFATRPGRWSADVPYVHAPGGLRGPRYLWALGLRGWAVTCFRVLVPRGAVLPLEDLSPIPPPTKGSQPHSTPGSPVC